MKIASYFSSLLLLFQFTVSEVSLESIHKVFQKKEFIEYQSSVINPVFAYLFKTTDFLQKIRIFSPLSQITLDEEGNRRYTADKSDDPVIQLIIHLFPSPTGSLNHVVNTSDNFGKHFLIDYRSIEKDKKSNTLKFLAKLFVTVLKADENNNILGTEIPQETRASASNLPSNSTVPNENFQNVWNLVNKNEKSKIFDTKLINLLSIHAFAINAIESEKDFEEYLSYLIKDEKIKNIQVPKLILDENSDILSEIYSIEKKMKIFPFSSLHPPAVNEFVRVCRKDPITDEYRFSETETFSDCSDILLLNICNALLFNPRIKKYDIKNLKPNSELAKFYTKHSNVFCVTSEIREDWSKVVQCLDDFDDIDNSKFNKHLIVYKRKDDRNEIKSGIINMMNVLIKIFELKHSKIWGKDEINSQTIQEKLQKLFKKIRPRFLNRKSFRVDIISKSIEEFESMGRTDFKGKFNLVFDLGRKRNSYSHKQIALEVEYLDTHGRMGVVSYNSGIQTDPRKLFSSKNHEFAQILVKKYIDLTLNKEFSEDMNVFLLKICNVLLVDPIHDDVFDVSKLGPDLNLTKFYLKHENIIKQNTNPNLLQEWNNVVGGLKNFENTDNSSFKKHLIVYKGDSSKVMNGIINMINVLIRIFGLDYQKIWRNDEITTETIQNILQRLFVKIQLKFGRKKGVFQIDFQKNLFKEYTSAERTDFTGRFDFIFNFSKCKEVSSKNRIVLETTFLNYDIDLNLFEIENKKSESPNPKNVAASPPAEGDDKKSLLQNYKQVISIKTVTENEEDINNNLKISGKDIITRIFFSDKLNNEYSKKKCLKMIFDFIFENPVDKNKDDLQKITRSILRTFNFDGDEDGMLKLMPYTIFLKEKMDDANEQMNSWIRSLDLKKCSVHNLWESKINTLAVKNIDINLKNIVDINMINTIFEKIRRLKSITNIVIKGIQDTKAYESVLLNVKDMVDLQGLELLPIETIEGKKMKISIFESISSLKELKILKLTKINIGWAKLNFLKEFPKLMTLSLSETQITYQNNLPEEPLNIFNESAKSLSSLDLSGNSLGFEGVFKILKALPNQQKLVTLNISNTDLEKSIRNKNFDFDQFKDSCFNQFKDFTSLKTLDMSDNELKTQTLNPILASIQNLKLQKFILSNNRLEDFNFNSLTSKEENICKSLNNLNLSDCRISYSLEFFEKLKWFESMAHLNLAYNNLLNIPSDSKTNIDEFSHLTNLTYLNLAGNNITNENNPNQGKLQLNFENCSKLEILNLSDMTLEFNNFNNDWKWITYLKKLRELDISSNRFSDNILDLVNQIECDFDSKKNISSMLEQIKSIMLEPIKSVTDSYKNLGLMDQIKKQIDQKDSSIFNEFRKNFTTKIDQLKDIPDLLKTIKKNICDVNLEKVNISRNRIHMSRRDELAKKIKDIKSKKQNLNIFLNPCYENFVVENRNPLEDTVNISTNDFNKSLSEMPYLRSEIEKNIVFDTPLPPLASDPNTSSTSSPIIKQLTGKNWTRNVDDSSSDVGSTKDDKIISESSSESDSCEDDKSIELFSSEDDNNRSESFQFEDDESKANNPLNSTFAAENETKKEKKRHNLNLSSIQ